MTTITLEDVRRHSENNTKESLYSPNKNRASWELYNENRRTRGEHCERIIAEMIERHTGYECQALRGNQAWDITVNLDDMPVRVEVKSALHSPKSVNSYNMLNIKPKNFDYIFIVLVTPEEITVKWASVSDIKKVCKNKQRHANGFALAVNRNKIPEYFYDLEDFPYNP